MNPYVLAGRQLRRLGYEPGPNHAGPWASPERLRLMARDLRRRGQWRIAAGIEALASELHGIARWLLRP